MNRKYILVLILTFFLFPFVGHASSLKIQEIKSFDFDLNLKKILENSDGSFDIVYTPVFMNQSEFSYFKVRSYCKNKIKSTINNGDNDICYNLSKIEYKNNELKINVKNLDEKSFNLKLKFRAFDKNDRPIDYIKKNIYIPSKK